MSREILKKLALPVLFLLITLSIFLVWKIFDLPEQEELLNSVQHYFDKYGLITVFISAIIEGLLLIGWYYPGSLVIVLGVIFAGQNLWRVIETLTLITLGLYIGYVINFFVGKYGWYRLLLKFGLREHLEKSQAKLIKNGPAAIFLSFWHPAAGALISTAAGIIQFPHLRFFALAAIALTIWNALWGTLVYFMGTAALSLIGFKFILAVILAWIAYTLYLNKKTPESGRFEL